jgi:mediator of RNA polymerase II transcription subunit 18
MCDTAWGSDNDLMSSHSYEVALFGEFFSQDLKPVLNRITLHSDSSQQIHTREIVFEPLDAHIQRDSAVLLRAKKELSQPNSTWFRFHHFNLLFTHWQSGNSFPT